MWVPDDGSLTHEEGHCIAQECMFDYCIYRRDKQYAECETLVDAWEAYIAAK